MAFPYHLFLLFAFVCGTSLVAQTQDVDLIPKPNNIHTHIGLLDLNEARPLYVHEGFESIIPLLKSIPGIKVSNSEVVKISSRRQRRQGIRILHPLDSDNIPKQGHKIVINENGIMIKAHKYEYLIPAIQTLYQLRLLQGEDSASLPFVIIEDQPRFSYRGVHLDVSTQFVPLPSIKSYIDLMALYKFNYFHWHLASGGGWRLQSNLYPALTETTAWRTHASFGEWEQSGKQYLKKGHPNAYGGYYTIADVRSIIQYAGELGITVIPELDILGPSSELVATFPTLLSSKSEALLLRKNILNEIVEIFPSPYINVGTIRTDQNFEENQDSLLLHLTEHLKSKDRKVIRWGNTSDRLTNKVSSGIILGNEQSVSELANAGQDLFLSLPGFKPAQASFPDPGINSPIFENHVSLKQAYEYPPSFETIPKEKMKHVLGIQESFWTKDLLFPQQIEYLAFPRLMALAEVTWTFQENLNFEDFSKRLQSHYALLQERQVNYSRPSFDINYVATFDPKKMINTVVLTTEQYKPEIRYTTDNTDPCGSSTLYHLPVELSGTTLFKAAIFMDTVRVGPVETIQLDIHKAIGRNVTYNTPWNDTYPAQGEKTLTNGEKGSRDFRDGQWQGFENKLEILIDLDRREEVNSLSMNFMQIPQANIFFPEEFNVFVSDNGKNFREIGRMKNDLITKGPHTSKRFSIISEKPVMARYVKVIAKSEQSGILLTDEVVIY